MRVNPELTRKVGNVVIRAGMVAGVVLGARAFNGNPESISLNVATSKPSIETPKANQSGAPILVLSPTLTPERRFPTPVALKKLDSKPTITLTTSLPNPDTKSLVSIPAAGTTLIRAPYTREQLVQEDINPSNPDTFANFGIAECKVAPTLQARSFGDNLVSYVSELLSVPVAEAADLNSATTKEKEDFLKCIKAVEATRPLFSAKDVNIADWNLNNLKFIDQDSIKGWRTRLEKELESKGIKISKTQLDEYVGTKINSVFLTKEGKLAPFQAQIEDLTEEELVKKYGKDHRGIYSYEEKLWIVIDSNNKLVVVFGECTNAVIATPPSVKQVAPSATPLEATPTPTRTQVVVTATNTPENATNTPTSAITTATPTETPVVITVTNTPEVATNTPVITTATPTETRVVATPTNTPENPTNTPTKPNTPTSIPTNTHTLPTYTVGATSTLVATRTPGGNTPTPIGTRTESTATVIATITVRPNTPTSIPTNTAPVPTRAAEARTATLVPTRTAGAATPTPLRASGVATATRVSGGGVPSPTSIRPGG